jgi:hypothetical protein
VGEGAGRIYLNFAKDWRSDFTVGVERKDVSAFTAAGIDLKGFAGKRVRVRGWVEWRNGPMIAATHRTAAGCAGLGRNEVRASAPSRHRALNVNGRD